MILFENVFKRHFLDEISAIRVCFTHAQQVHRDESKRQVSEHLYFSLHFVIPMGFSFLIHESVLMTLYLKNRRVCPVQEPLNKLWSDPMIEAAQQ